MNDVIIIGLSSLGAIFILLAGIGLLKMPDFYMRVSISTKAITLGTGLILVSAAIAFQDFSITSRVIAIILFIILTAPVAAHMIGKAAYFTEVKLWKNTSINDLQGKYNRRQHTLDSIKEKNKATNQKHESKK